MANPLELVGGIPTATQLTFSNISGVATVSQGGTGDSSFTAYSVICGGTTSTGALQSVSGLGSSGQALVSNGASALPTWQGVGSVTSVALTVPAFLSVSGSPVTSSGTLAVTFSGTAIPVANGGSGQTSLTAHDVLVGNGTSGITQVSPSTSGYVLTSNGTSSDPSFQTPVTSGLRTINAQTGTTYTFALTDGSGNGNNPLVTFSNSSAQTITVPAHSSVAFPVGTQIDCIQQGSGKVTFSAAGGVTINSQGGNLSIGAQYVGVSLVNTATDTWTLIGYLVT